MSIHIFIRADASIQLGTGHVMRCLTLAEELSLQGVKVSFACCTLPGNLCCFLEKHGYEVYRLRHSDSPSEEMLIDPLQDAMQTIELLKLQETEIDWLIIDHYLLDEDWEQQMRPYVKKIMVIDDLANRNHDCDLLLDQNFYLDMDQRYDSLLPETCRKLLGPKYALLREEFRTWKERVRPRDGTVQRILVFLGGSDPYNVTVLVLEAFQALNTPQLIVDVVVGKANPHKEKIHEQCSQMPSVHYHCQIENMAELMSKADLMIGAGGTASWERCMLGLPAMVIIIAENQVKVTEALEAREAIINLGWYHQLTVQTLAKTIFSAVNNPSLLKTLSIKSMELMEDADATGQSLIWEMMK